MKKNHVPTAKSRPKCGGDCMIPLDIYQTWHTKDPERMMLGMREAQELIKGNNPEFRHHVFDDEDCLEFMRSNFDAKVVEAYESLIPTAYKADLWRYCILYVCGGIYLDIKFRPCDGFKFMELVNDEYFVLDRADLVGRPCVYNALIVAKAGNVYLKKCIDKSVYNILNRNYGVCALDITGPTMMASCFPYGYYMSLGYLRFDGNDTDNYYIITGDEPERKLLEFYREYRDEQRMTEKVERYHSLWNKRAVFVEQACSRSFFDFLSILYGWFKSLRYLED